MLAHLLAAACAVAAPCTTARAEATFKPYVSGLAPITYITSNRAEPKRLYVVEQDGRIVYLVGGRVRGTFLDLRSVVRSGGEQGLLSVAFHPAYAKNHRFYVDYTDRNGDTRVVEFRSRKGKGIRSTARQLLFVKQPFPNHNGGQLQFGPDGQLYVGMGDGGSAGDPGEPRPEPLRAARQALAGERDRRARRSGGSPGTASGTRGASPSTRTATCTSATSARTNGRRSTTARAPSSTR